MIRPLILLLCAAAANAEPTEPAALPAESPYRCTAPYTLAPGERRLLACQFKPIVTAGLAQVQSRHADVDASVVTVAPRAVVFVLTNRSTAPVDAVAIVDRL